MTLHADSSVDDFVAFIANERVSVEDAGRALALFKVGHPAEAVMLERFLSDPVDMIRRHLTLRAEVERLRDEASTEADRAPDGGVIEHWWIGKQRGMETVLDLIDKHTREGQ